jgi:hypothetical protein
MRPLRLSILFAAIAICSNAATLIHSYTFDGNANDGTGSANGTLSGSASVSGGFLHLNGSTDYLQFGTGLIPGSGSFSVLISAQLDTSLPSGLYIELISQEGQFYLGPTAGTGIIRIGDAWSSTGTAYPDDGAWHTFGVVSDVDANTTYLYVDGFFRASRAGTTNPPSGPTGTRLGRQYNGHAEYFDGRMDNFRVYSGALSGGEVFTLSNGSSEVPEPWTMALTGAGLIVVGLRRKLRAKHHHAG